MKIPEKLIVGALATSAALTVLITFGVLYTLASEAVYFFSEVSIKDFLTDTQSNPLFIEKHFGILPLLSGTILTSLIAVLIALPVGLTVIYLTEYAPGSFAFRIKPILEILAAVPTVVYGYFALTVVTPFLQQFIPGLSSFNALGAGFVMGIMIIPLISSMSQERVICCSEVDAGSCLRTWRHATANLFPGTGSRRILRYYCIRDSGDFTCNRRNDDCSDCRRYAAQSYLQPNRCQIRNDTTYIVQIHMGDVPHGSLEYRTIFAAGISLFALTFLLNNLSFWFKKKYHQKYE